MPHGLKDFTDDVHVVEGWWRRYPKANIGLRLDHGFVLDIDSPDQWREHGVSLEAVGPWQFTGSGGDRVQIVYTTSQPERYAFNRPIPGTGAETKGFGLGYVAIGPSETKGPYRWQQSGPIPEAPPALLEILPRAGVPTSAPDAFITIGEHDGYQLPEKVGEGERYAAVRDYGASLWAKGYDLEDAWHLVATKLAPRFTTPKSEAELRGDFDRAMSTIERKYGEQQRRERELVLPEGDPFDLTGAVLMTGVDASPAPPRIHGRWDTGSNVLYGRGGVGKGLFVSHEVTQLVADGERVLVVDYEGHPEEYARRLRALGCDLGQVLHVSPLDPHRWQGKIGAIWDVAPRLRELADAFGATWVVVDSITPAAYGADPISAETPQQYAQAITLLGRPTISIGQVNRVGDLRYPFGSVLWHYLVRASWSIETPPGGTRGTNLLLTDRKANNYAAAERVQADVTWWEDLPRAVDERPYLYAIADRIDIVLGDKAMTATEITADLNEEAEAEDDKVEQATVRKTLRRGLDSSARQRKRYTINGSGKTAKWSRV